MDGMFVRYDDGQSGTFYKHFPGTMLCTRDTPARNILMHMLPYSVFSAWKHGECELFIIGFGKVEYSTTIQDVATRAERSWIVIIRD